MLTSGISAEYGRFSGGVINVVTKSGGDQFSGTFRSNFTNDDWQTLSPFEKERNITKSDKVNQSYEGTFGGPILRVQACGSSRPDASPRHPNTAPLAAVGRVRSPPTPPKARRDQAAPDTSPTTTRSGQLHEQRANSCAYRSRPSRSTRRPPRTSELPERPLRRQLPRRAERRGCLPTSAISQKKFGFRGSGGTVHEPQRLADHRPEPQSVHYNAQLLRRDRPRESRQLPGRGQPVVRADHAAASARTTSRAASRCSTATRTGGNSQCADRLRRHRRLPADRCRRPVLRRAGTLHPGVRAGRDASTRTGSRRAARRSTRARPSFYIQDTWRATGRLCVRPRHALREGPRRGDRRHPHRGHRHLRAASGGTYDITRRRPLRRAGHLRVVRGQVQRDRSLPTTRRSATRRYSRASTSDRRGRAATSRRASTRPTTCRHRRRVPDGQRLLRAWPVVAGHPGVHGVAGRGHRRAAFAKVHVRRSRRHQLRRGLHHARGRRDDDRRRRHRLRHVPERQLPQQRPARSVGIRRWSFQGRYPLFQRLNAVRQLHAAAQERRQLRGRGRQHAGRLVAVRRLPGGLHARRATTRRVA